MFFCKYWARRQVGKAKRHWGGWVNPPKNSFLAHTVLVGCVIQKRTVHNDHTLSMSSLQMYTIYRKVLSSSNILVDLTTTPIFLKTSIQRILIWRKIYLVDKCDGIYFESATTEIHTGLFNWRIFEWLLIEFVLTFALQRCAKASLYTNAKWDIVAKLVCITNILFWNL